MTRHTSFEWDEEKAASNLQKHRVSFDEAAEVLADPFSDRFHIEEFDADHSDEEDRMRTTGSDPQKRQRVLVITWTLRRRVTRIISARVASPRERKAYEQETQGW